MGADGGDSGSASRTAPPGASTVQAASSATAPATGLRRSSFRLRLRAVGGEAVSEGPTRAVTRPAGEGAGRTPDRLGGRAKPGSVGPGRPGASRIGAAVGAGGANCDSSPR